MKKDIITVSTDYNITNQINDGYYDIKYHGNYFEFEGEKYTYHNSGLNRCVYLSEDGKWVIKVPISDGRDEKDIKEFVDFVTGKIDYHIPDPSMAHNYYEAMAYKKCPKKFKKYLAKTYLLKNCWVKQEFVKVKQLHEYGISYGHFWREVGITEDKRLVLFDYDPLLYKYVYRGPDWELFAEKMEHLIKHIPTT